LRETPALVEFPEGLPEKGVLVVQMPLPWDIANPDGDGFLNDKVHEKFLQNLISVYGDRNPDSPVPLEYHDQPGQCLDQDINLLDGILSNVSDRAVSISFIVQGRGDEGRRHRELEQQLVQLLLREGIVVSLVGATGAMTARAQLYLRSRHGEPKPVLIDLEPYLEKSPTARSTSVMLKR
jgi:hypothetical protein